MAAVTFDKEPENRGGFHSWQGEREKAERARNEKKVYVDERGEGNRAKEERREGREQTGERGLDRGVKSGDLQVQLEQPMTLMVY